MHTQSREDLVPRTSDPPSCSRANARAIVVYSGIFICGSSGIVAFFLVAFNVIGPTFYAFTALCLFSALVAVVLGCECYRCDCPSCFPCCYSHHPKNGVSDHSMDNPAMEATPDAGGNPVWLHSDENRACFTFCALSDYFTHYDNLMKRRMWQQCYMHQYLKDRIFVLAGILEQHPGQ